MEYATEVLYSAAAYQSPRAPPLQKDVWVKIDAITPTGSSSDMIRQMSADYFNHDQD